MKQAFPVWRFGVFATGWLIVIGGALVVPAAARAEPADDELASQVTIRRDKFGVPHITAPTEEAAAFGQGYVVAEDHVLVLGRLLLKARSEEAAYFGAKEGEYDIVAADALCKRLHIYEGAAVGYAKMAPWVQRIAAGYAAGYNHYVRKHRAELPEYVQPATPIDFLAHGRRVLLGEFDINWRQIDEIGKPKKEASASARWPYDFAMGSNMWAIGKDRSASGNALLLGNPHLDWSGSQLWCEVHIQVPHKINMYGATLVGSPVITIGFNENLGWSHTVNVHDCGGVYELTPDPKDSGNYVYDGKPLPLRKEEYAIKVKTDAGVVEKKITGYWSHYGPVVKQHEGKLYALKSASLDEYDMIEQWNLMAKAKSLGEFRKVLDMQTLPMFNICYADKKGNCFYIHNGRFPDRPAGYDWEGTVPGNTSASEWNHVLPQSRLPALVNPKGAYVQNCNSAPWYTNVNQFIERKRFPADLTPNFNSMRTQLSLEMIENDPKITLEKVLAYKYNTKLLLADRVKEDLLKAVRGQTVNGIALDEAAELLQQWDNTASRDSKGALLFTEFWRRYGKQAKKPYQTPWDEKHPASTPSGLGEPETAREALASAVKELKQDYGTLAVVWGDVHRLRRGSLDVPIGGFLSEYRSARDFEEFQGARFGDFGAFRVLRFRKDKEKDGKYVARGGDSYVFAVEFTSPPTAHSICAYSQSDDPKSPHYTDQSELFAKEQWKRAWFTDEDIAKNLEREYHP
jgi:acyl-homoserine-lactone acylase